MIDLHCHILPGIDDGASELSDAIAMARQAADDGIEAICATPHIRDDHDVRIEEIEARAKELSGAVEQEGIPVAVLSGGEVAETVAERLDSLDLARVGLGGGPWILLEPAPGPLSGSLERRVEHLAERGHRCVIAHPERHVASDMVERLTRLVRQGALIQATADFFLHKETAGGMLALAGRGLVHVLGSDAHSSRFGRPVRLGPGLEALAAVEKLRPHLEWIAREAPAAIVRGDQLEAPFAPG